MKYFLTARYMGATDDMFENAEIYRLGYKLAGKGISIEDALEQGRSYATLKDFFEDWDMHGIPERYKQDNPELDNDPTR